MMFFSLKLQSQPQQDQNQASSTQQQNDGSNNGAIIPSMDFEYELSMAEIASYCSIPGMYNQSIFENFVNVSNI